ncbi:MAG: flavodoxin [Bacteroidales bacterium]
MKKIGIIYSFNTVKTGQAVKTLVEALGEKNVVLINAEDITEKQFLKFDNLILGVPTWFDGELPNYWDEFVPAIEDMELKGKRIAIFGNGDQKNYPENFVDGIGLMANLLESKGATLAGFTSVKGYSFESSRAVRADQFCGLALDYENQAKQNKERISKWVEQLKKEFA